MTTILYSKKCCKCEHTDVIHKDFIGDYDLVLCSRCYLDIFYEEKMNILESIRDNILLSNNYLIYS
jgi:hypothetical protein